MSDYLYTVSFETLNNADADAAMELMREMGFRPKLKRRLVGKDPVHTATKDTRLGKAVLEAMELGRSYHYETVGATIEAKGYQACSAASALAKMVEEGVVERIGRGIYKKIGSPVLRVVGE